MFAFSYCVEFNVILPLPLQAESVYTHTTLFTKAWQIQSIDISIYFLHACLLAQSKILPQVLHIIVSW